LSIAGDKNKEYIKMSVIFPGVYHQSVAPPRPGVCPMSVKRAKKTSNPTKSGTPHGYCSNDKKTSEKPVLTSFPEVFFFLHFIPTYAIVDEENTTGNAV